MDPFEVPVSRLTVRPAAFRLLGAMAAAGWAMAGCAPSPEAPRLTQPQGRREVSRALQKQVKKAAGAPVGLEVEGLGGNDFTVEDADGRRVLTAKVARVAGRVKPGTGLDGPVVLEKANCTLYRHGKPHL
ncbi:MAG: hypothetical protein FJX77_14955, partial [Armatimonadetes bacterium]|nr:hypothetical protein [Armatimonadota bacterium]